MTKSWGSRKCGHLAGLPDQVINLGKPGGSAEGRRAQGWVLMGVRMKERVWDMWEGS